MCVLDIFFPLLKDVTKAIAQNPKIDQYMKKSFCLTCLASTTIKASFPGVGQDDVCVGVYVKV